VLAATMTSGLRLTSSRARAGNRSILPSTPPVLDLEILPFDVAELAHCRHEGTEEFLIFA
jgi:hypothetical protein